MVLEQKIQDLTGAVEKAAEAFLGLGLILQELQELGASGKGAAEPAKAPKGGTGGKPKPAEAPPERKKKITKKVMTDLFVSFLQSEEEEDEKQRLVEIVKPILAHYGVSRFTEISPADYEAVYVLGETLVSNHELGGLDAAEAVVLFPSEDEETQTQAGDIL